MNLKSNNVLSLSEKTSYHSAIWDAFNFEPINKRFYRELVDRFIVLRDHLTLQNNISLPESVSFATRLIGRLLFVKFLDKKGLINSKIEYFSAPSGDTKIQTTYYKEKLEALFYKTLNTEIPDRGFSDIITPYLNGGLFDASDSDFYDKNIVTFPDNYFNVFQSVLAKYNFTVDESSPEFQQVAVDPEMLGRIFESLLGEMETKEGDSLRSATGAFYTSREIVSYMCEQSVLEYLKSKITDSPERDRRLIEIITMSESLFRDQDQNKRRDWKPYAQPILDALETLTVLDPAVGSGAYPMGMLHLLIKIYTRLDSKYEKNLSKLKRDILSRSLYGSDISTTAIEICRLRAWLSLIVDISQGEQVVPLPNLEFHFVCANSLISLSKDVGFFDIPDLKDKMSEIRRDYYSTNSKAKKQILINKYQKLLNPEKLSIFGGIDNELRTYTPFIHESIAGFFDPELMLGQEKFNIVIGNPPYVSTKGVDPKDKKKLEENFGFSDDLYSHFYFKGLELCKDQGVLSYITSKTFWTIQTKKNVRELLLNNNFIDIYDTANPFESVMV
ncbi:MAG: Eco57I restriction-modification methylase domain-containing protein, partial [archaeon]